MAYVSVYGHSWTTIKNYFYPDFTANQLRATFKRFNSIKDNMRQTVMHFLKQYKNGHHFKTLSRKIIVIYFVIITIIHK